MKTENSVGSDVPNHDEKTPVEKARESLKYKRDRAAEIEKELQDPFMLTSIGQEVAGMLREELEFLRRREGLTQAEKKAQWMAERGDRTVAATEAAKKKRDRVREIMRQLKDPFFQTPIGQQQREWEVLMAELRHLRRKEHMTPAEKMAAWRKEKKEKAALERARAEMPLPCSEDEEYETGTSEETEYFVSLNSKRPGLELLVRSAEDTARLARGDVAAQEKMLEKLAVEERQTRPSLVIDEKRERCHNRLKSLRPTLEEAERVLAERQLALAELVDEIDALLGGSQDE